MVLTEHIGEVLTGIAGLIAALGTWGIFKGRREAKDPNREIDPQEQLIIREVRAARDESRALLDRVDEKADRIGTILAILKDRSDRGQ